MDLLPFINQKIRKKKAEDIVLSYETRKQNQIKFTNNNISSIKTWSNNFISIFCSIKKKIIVTTLEDFSKKGVNELVKNITKFKKKLQQKEDYFGIAKGPFKYKIQKYDKKIVNLSEKAVDLVENSINIAVNNGAERCSGLFEFSNFDRQLLTSNNVEAKDKGTNCYYSIRAFNRDGSGHKVHCGRFLDSLKIIPTAKEAAEIATASLNPKTIKTGKYDIIFDPLPFSNILNHVAMSSSISAVESGFSCLGNKLNKKVANNKFTLIDDATLTNGYNSLSFDDEGVPTKKNTIIKNGVLKTYLYNTSYARKYKTKTTANSGLIDPSPWNIVLKKGDYSKEEMIKEVKKGLLITNTWYTRFQNYLKGNFSTIPRDGIFLIQNGNIKHPVKDIRLSDNLLNIIKNTSVTGKKIEEVVSWEAEIPTITPTVLSKDINITRSTS